MAQIDKSKEELILKSTLNTMTDIFYVFDKDGKFLIWNDAFRKVAGYSDEELYSMKSQDFFSGEDIGRITASVERIWKEGVSKETANFVIKDGTRIPYEFTGAVIKDNAGNIIGFSGTGRDLTDRKKVEQALHFSMTKLDLALKSSGMGVWQFNIVEGKRIFDDQVCLLLGIDPVTFRGSKDEFLARVHPEDRERITSGLAHTIDTAEAYETDYRVIWLDGSIHCIATRGKLIRDNNGVPQMINGVVWDITERKRMEDELKTSEDKFKTIFDYTNDGIIITGLKDLKFYEANKSMCRMLGYSLQELKKLNVTDIHPTEELGYVSEQIEKHAKDHLAPAADLPVKRKDGSIFPASVLGTRVILSGKEYMVAVFRDITERKRMEMASVHLKAIVESAEDCIVGKDLSSIITSWNQGAEKMFGYSASEMVGTSIMRLIPSDRQNEETLIMDKIKRGEVVGHFETVRQTKDGRLMDVSVTVSPIKDPSGRIIGVSKIIRDITDRKKLEKQLQEKVANLEKLNNIMIGRELRVIDIKKEVNKLCRELGKPEPYGVG